MNNGFADAGNAVSAIFFFFSYCNTEHVAQGFAAAAATKGLCGRPLETFAAFTSDRSGKLLCRGCSFLFLGKMQNYLVVICRSFAPAGATKGLCGRPLETFAALSLVRSGNMLRRPSQPQPRRQAQMGVERAEGPSRGGGAAPLPGVRGQGPLASCRGSALAAAYRNWPRKRTSPS